MPPIDQGICRPDYTTVMGSPTEPAVQLLGRRTKLRAAMRSPTFVGETGQATTVGRVLFNSAFPDEYPPLAS